MARPEITGKKSAAISRRRRPRTRPLSTPPACYTVTTFCQAHHISESFYYKLKKKRRGPREMQVGARTFITFEAAADWRTQNETAATIAAE